MARVTYFSPSAIRAVLVELWHDKVAFIGLLTLLIIILMSILAPQISPYDPAAQSLVRRLVPPVWAPKGTWEHILGTDNLGRDVFSRLLWGGRVSLTITIVTALIAGSIGTVVGLWAGFAGGRTDSFLMRIVDVQISFPGILLILLMVGVIGPGMWTLIAVLSVTNWMIYARLVRSIVSSARQTDYVEAAEVIGCRPTRVIFRHILPNLISPLITLLILECTNIMLAEAAISFLGFGIQPPATSWGLNVAAGRDYLFVAWWLATIPGLAIVVTVLSANLFANWLRVTTNPEERERRYARAVSSKRRRMK